MNCDVEMRGGSFYKERLRGHSQILMTSLPQGCTCVLFHERCRDRLAARDKSYTASGRYI